MRAWLTLALAAAIVAVLARPAAAREAVDMRGKAINFFSDRLLLAGNDAVVEVPGRVTLHADIVRYDLRNDRVIGAGNVHVTLRGEPLDAAAVSVDLHSGVAYAIVLDPLPDTLKITHERLAGAVHEAAPADVFSIADVEGARPWLYGPHAIVTQDVGVRFSPAKFPTGAGVNLPSPNYLYIFAPNPNYSNNPLPGVSFDQPYALATGPHSADLSHLRFDSSNGATLGFDHHLVFGDTTYAIASIAPIDRAAKTAAFVFSQKMGPKINQSLNATYNVFDTGFNAPLSDSLSTSYQISRALRQSYLQLNVKASNNSLLPPPANGMWWGDPSHSWDPRHPFSAEVDWNEYDVKLHNGFSFRLGSAFGYDHDALGEIPSANDPVPYNTIWHHSGSLVVTSPLFKYRDASLQVSIEQDEEWWSYPHRQDKTIGRATLQRRVSRYINLIGTYDFANQLDDYHARQLVFFAPPKLPYNAPDGTPWPGFLAYTGATTNRDYRLDAYYTPNGYFNLTTSFVGTHDFPQFHGYGRQPYSVSFDMRARPLHNIGLELGRSYYFNWNHQSWSPQWTFAVSP